MPAIESVCPWWAGVRMRAEEMPTVPRAALVFNDDAVGSIAHPLAVQLCGHRLPVRFDPAGDSVRLLGDPTRSLAEIAAWLREHEHAAPWRDELIAVTTKSGRRIGCVERAVVRNLGISTQAVQLHGQAAKTNLYWLQQRAFDKATDPGRWDTLIGGLVADGETPLQTLGREALEEAGLRINDLASLKSCGSFTQRRPVHDAGTHGYMVETLHALRCVVPAACEPSNMDGEVARFDRFDRYQIVEAIDRSDVTLEAAIAIALCEHSWSGRD